MDKNTTLGLIVTLIESMNSEQLAGALLSVISQLHDGSEELVIAHVEALLKIGSSQNN